MKVVILLPPYYWRKNPEGRFSVFRRACHFSHGEKIAEFVHLEGENGAKEFVGRCNRAAPESQRRPVLRLVKE